MSFIEQKPKQRNIIASKVGRFLPHVAVPEEASGGHGMPQPGSSTFSPDADFDETATHFVSGFSSHESDPRFYNSVEFVGKAGENATLLGGYAPVVSKKCGKDLAKPDKILNVSRPQ